MGVCAPASSPYRAAKRHRMGKVWGVCGMTWRARRGTHTQRTSPRSAERAQTARRPTPRSPLVHTRTGPALNCGSGTHASWSKPAAQPSGEEAARSAPRPTPFGSVTAAIVTTTTRTRTPTTRTGPPRPEASPGARDTLRTCCKGKATGWWKRSGQGAARKGHDGSTGSVALLVLVLRFPLRLSIHLQATKRARAQAVTCLRAARCGRHQRQLRSRLGTF